MFTEIDRWRRGDVASARKHALLESEGTTVYGGRMYEEKHRSFDSDFPFIRKLCPQFSEDELREANATFMDYLSVCLRIFERLEEEERHGPSSLTKTDAEIRSDRSTL